MHANDQLSTKTMLISLLTIRILELISFIKYPLPITYSLKLMVLLLT